MHAAGGMHTRVLPELTAITPAVRPAIQNTVIRRRHVRLVVAVSGPHLRQTGQPASRWAEPLLQCSASSATPVAHSDQQTAASASEDASTTRSAASVRTPEGGGMSLQQQLTAATAAAQASTAHAGAMQAAYDAQSVSRSSRGNDDPEQQQQPSLRDAFSRRDGWEQMQAGTPDYQAASFSMQDSSTAGEAARSAGQPLTVPHATDHSLSELNGDARRWATVPAEPDSSGAGGGLGSGSGDIGSPGHELVDLLGGAEDDRMGRRARSASDANV
jgi:hypothetical protein